MISFRSSVGISSGPGAFLLFSFLIALIISTKDGYSVLYSSSFSLMIGFWLNGELSSWIPHCFSLKCFAASCALLLWWMCSPSWFLLWKGVGLYFLLGSLNPSHLSLRSRSLETDSIILCFLSSFLLFVNCLSRVMNSFRFLFLAALFLCSSISFEVWDSSNLLFLSFASALGSVVTPF